MLLTYIDDATSRVVSLNNHRCIVVIFKYCRDLIEIIKIKSPCRDAYRGLVGKLT